jgi:hypothetical protein
MNQVYIIVVLALVAFALTAQTVADTKAINELNITPQSDRSPIT